MEAQNTMPRSDAPITPGTVLGGRYEIIEAADEASFGVLYRAKVRGDGKIVTVQVLDQRLFSDPRLRAAVRREIDVLGKLEHKNLATPIDFGDAMVQSGTLAFVVYENLDGQSLAEMHQKKRAQGKPFSLKGAYNVVAHLTNGLHALHESSPGAVHGGLSMRSVHVSSQGRVKVLELGLARALLAAGGKATVAQVAPQLAPETQSSLDRLDRRADVFAVGAILYELLTGVAPASPVAPAASTINPALPRAIDVLLDQCLREDPAARVSDMLRLKELLQQAVGPDVIGNTGGAGATAPPVAATTPVLSSAPKPPPPRPVPPPPAAATAPKPPPPRPAPPPPAAVPKSFNVDTALSSIDDSHERWLIQKDKLDFGPFNLRDVKAQIETGKIQGEHTIVDTESGERRRVKDHPQLRDLVLATEAQGAENERLRLEQADRQKHRGRVVSLLVVLMLVVLAGGGGLFWYVQHMKAKVVVVKETVESDLKFDITMKVDPPEKKVGGKKTHRVVNGKNVFDDSTVLGDASEGGGDETLDGATVQRVMNQNFKVLVGCVKEEKSRNPALHNVDMDFIIKGSGSVSAVKVNGQTGGAFAGCMYGKMQTIAFPKFNGSKTHASFSLAFK